MTFNYKLVAKDKQKKIFFLQYILTINNYENVDFNHYRFYFEEKSDLNNLIREVLTFEYFTSQYGFTFPSNKFLKNKKFTWLQETRNDLSPIQLEKCYLSSFDFYYIDKNSAEYLLNIDQNDLDKFKEKLKIISNDFHKEHQQQLKEKIDYKTKEQYLNTLLFNKINSFLDEENINDKLHCPHNQKQQKL